MDSGSAARALFRDRARLLGYVTAIVRDADLADDVFQEVTLLAMQRAGRIRDVEHLLLWARKAGRYKALEALRAKGGGWLPLDDDVLDALEAEWDAAGSDAAGSDAAAEQLHDLRRCMQRLSARARRILHLRYSDGLSGLQLAETLTIGVASVYVALSRIHRALRDCMARRRGMAGETDERVVAGQLHQR
jgi:RNA polymerase sigma-70 factor (ECF subfamily)